MLDAAALAPYAQHVLAQAEIPGLPKPYHGKVRENYDLPGGRRVLIATDRLSAFDRILCAVPFKGEVLTRTARYWFEATGDICPNHVLAYPDPNVLLARRLDILPVEMVVRGYLAGTTGTSVLTLYKAGQRAMYGLRLPDGLRDNERLPAPILTPTSKEFDGGHDAPLSPEQIIAERLLTAAQWEELSALSLALFARGQAMAAERGLILADTKYEFGIDADGRIVLADEMHTPDSSRYWRAASYDARFAAGERPESFDKDFIRAWVAARCDPYRDEIPPIPAALILATSAVYIEAFETITGQTFTLPDPGEDVLGRVRRNLASLVPEPEPERIAYKIMTQAELQQMQRDGVFRGSPADIADGYIHLSSGSQLAATLDKHFSGIGDLMLAAVDLSRLGGTVRWEPARGGQLFPHIYGVLPLTAVVSVATLERTADGAVKLPA